MQVINSNNKLNVVHATLIFHQNHSSQDIFPQLRQLFFNFTQYKYTHHTNTQDALTVFSFLGAT